MMRLKLSLRIRVYRKFIFIPNVFSPNQDGINDIFYLQANPEITDINTFRVFDRWGNMVFQSGTIPSQWDGKFDGTPMNPGVYIYRIEVSYFDQAVERKGILHGDITLIR
jgi:gliding motility-associated-like protein